MRCVSSNLFERETVAKQQHPIKIELWTMPVTMQTSLYKFGFLLYLRGDKLPDWLMTKIFGILCSNSLQSHIDVHVNEISICLCLSLHSSVDFDMCRLAACFTFTALLPQLMNWKLHSCHLSPLLPPSRTLCFLMA